MVNILKVDKLKLLHAIRGFGAFYVVVVHAKMLLWCKPTEYLAVHPLDTLSWIQRIILGFNMVSIAGIQMVIVFFVLSGFFIAYSFDKNKHTHKAFFINRAIRIYVPYIGSLILGVAILYLIGVFYPEVYRITIDREFNSHLIIAYHSTNLSNLSMNLLFLPHPEYIGYNGVYWTLFPEALFYLIVPLWISRPNFYFYSSLLLHFIGIFLNINDQYGNLRSFIFSYNVYFALGLFLYYHIYKLHQWVGTIPYAKIYLCVLSFLFLCLTSVFNLLDVPIKYINMVGAGFACSLIVLFVSFDFSENFFLKIFKKLGEISFSLYLIHVPILILVYAILYHYTHQTVFYGFVYPIGIAISLLLSFPFYWYIEKPSVRWISRLKKRTDNPT